ncbi:MAG: DUF4340 domain-containing protein [Betaproteobacteria bacterium]
MTRGWLLNGVLFVAVAALAAFVVLKPRSDVTSHHGLTMLKADRVNAIRLERSGDPPIVLQRKQGKWMLVAPLSARADSLQVERMLGILDASPAHSTAMQDLARFGLDRPLTRLVIDGTQFDFGSVNAVTREQYVHTAGMVHAVAPRYGAAMPASAAQLVAKQPFDPDDAPVRMAFPEFSIAHDGSRWQISPPVGDLGQDDINRWIDGWRHASALRTEPYAASGGPPERVEITMRSGTSVTLHVLQKSPELILGRPDEKLRYHFAGEAAKRLLSPPETAR